MPPDFPMKFIAELKSFLAGLRTDYRLRRNWPAVNEIAGAQAIADDIERTEDSAGRHAFAAEQADLDAARLIRESIADNRVTADEIPLLRSALRHVTNSASHDRAITQII
jgi:hypothetical protein